MAYHFANLLGKGSVLFGKELLAHASAWAT